MMEIVFNLTQADLQTFQSHLRSRPPKPARLALCLGYCLGIGLGVLFTLQSVIEAVSDDLSGAITNTLLLLPVICWLVLAWWLNSGAYKKWLISQFLGEYHLIVSTAGIHSIGPHGQRFASWPEIRALEETEVYVFIYLTRNGYSRWGCHHPAPLLQNRA
jgi:ABC-type nitrate/sulfonate/bicarbonate transport system permease component